MEIIFRSVMRYPTFHWTSVNRLVRYSGRILLFSPATHQWRLYNRPCEAVFTDFDFPSLGTSMKMTKITPDQLVQNGKVGESPKSTMTVPRLIRRI